MEYVHILFDLDGTLTDPYEGITNSIKYALGKFGVYEQDAGKFRLCIGPPLEKLFREYYFSNVDTAKKAVEYYREYFSEKGIYENILYDGTEAVLRELNKRNKKCFLATSKPEVFARRILRHFHIDKYFMDITGSNLEGTFAEKTDIIEYVIRHGNLNKEQTIMVGDTRHDIRGARENAIASIAAAYGYGTREELENENPTYICAAIADILRIIT
jgi:phosphoglycolate phosphatase